jgi:hypothetical protein
MEGWPVWLVSVSARRSGKIVPTSDWSRFDWEKARKLMHRALRGVGDETKERDFRMCVTACRHRALSKAEIVTIPDEWFDTPAVHLAGGPVEVLGYRGISEQPSCQACANPGRTPIPEMPHLYFPKDCGACESCLARKACRAKTISKTELLDRPRR